MKIKSLRSVLNFWQKNFLITAVFAVVFTSCDKDKDEYSSPTPFSGGISGTIEGVYANWDFVAINFNGRDIIETTPIIDGKFTFSSLPTPKPEYLEPFIESEEIPSNFQIQISDRDAKLCNIPFLLAIKGEIDASYYGIIIAQSVVAVNSVTRVLYYYADRDVKIKGSYSSNEIGIKQSSEINMNLNLKQGWNTVHLITVGTEENGLTRTLKNGLPFSETAWTALTGIF